MQTVPLASFKDPWVSQGLVIVGLGLTDFPEPLRVTPACTPRSRGPLEWDSARGQACGPKGIPAGWTERLEWYSPMRAPSPQSPLLLGRSITGACWAGLGCRLQGGLIHTPGPWVGMVRPSPWWLRAPVGSPCGVMGQLGAPKGQGNCGAGTELLCHVPVVSTPTGHPRSKGRRKASACNGRVPEICPLRCGRAASPSSLARPSALLACVSVVCCCVMRYPNLVT